MTESFFRDVDVPPYEDDDHLPTFLPEWTARGVLETVTAIEVQPMLDAAQASRPLWPAAESPASDEGS